MKNDVKVQTKVTISKLVNGKWVDVSVRKNTIVDLGLRMLAERISNNTVSQITHIAIGDNGSPTTNDMTSLVNERIRKEVSYTVFDNSVEFKATFNNLEANFNWKEIGLVSDFGLFDRILEDFTKTSEDTVTVKFLISFVRGD